jgi:hypothetical protein
MPEEAVVEMVADALGASRGYTGLWPVPGKWTWINKDRLLGLPLHRCSFLLFCALLSSIGFAADVAPVFAWSDIDQCTEFSALEMARIRRLRALAVSA